MPISYTKPKGHDRNGNPRFEPDPKKYLYNVDTFGLMWVLIIIKMF